MIHPAKVLTPVAPGPLEIQRPAFLQWQLHCPGCGEIGVGQGSDITVQGDRDQYDSPIGTRGGYVQVELWCPEGHQFALVVAGHEGTQFLAVVPWS